MLRTEHLSTRTVAAGPDERRGLVFLLVVSLAWLILCFAFMVLLVPSETGVGLLVRIVVAAVPLGALWILYSAGRGTPLAVMAIFLSMLMVTDLSFRNRTFSDTSADPQNMLKMLLWGSGLLVVLLNPKHLRDVLREPAVALLASLSVWFMFTAVYSPIPLYSFASALALLAVTLFGAVVRRVVPEPLLLKGAIGLLTLMLLVGLVLYVVAPGRAMAETEGGSVLRLAAPFGTPNQLGRVAALVLLLAVLSWQTRVVRWNSLLPILGSVAALACLVLSQSRTSIAAVAVSLTALLLLSRPRWLFLSAVFFSAAALLFVLFDMSLLSAAKLISRTGDTASVVSLTGRTDIWGFFWDEILKAPIFGYGHASTKYYMPMLYHNAWGWTSTQAHNMWLQVAFTSGLIGVVLLAGTIIAQFRYWWHTRDSASLGILVFVFVSGLAEAAHGGGAPNTLTLVWAVWMVGRRIPKDSVTSTAAVVASGQAFVPASRVTAVQR